MICSTCSLVQRSRVHNSSMNFIASAGWLFTNGMNSRRSMIKSSQLVFAVASADRTCPSSTVISPKISPAPIKFRMALRPSIEEMLIFTVPLITANMLVPGSPLEKIVAPRFSVACFA